MVLCVDLEMDVCCQYKGLGFVWMIVIVVFVDGGYVIGIKQVIYIELQIEVFVDLIVQFGVGNLVVFGVIWGIDCIIVVLVQVFDIVYIVVDGQIVGGLILCLQCKGMFWGVGQGGRFILCNVLFFCYCCMLLSVVGDNCLVWGQVFGCGEFIFFYVFFVVL